MGLPDIQQLRKAASIENGRRALFPEHKTQDLDGLQAIEAEKIASADQDLLIIATALQPEDPIGMYEELGGRYANAERE